MQRGDNERTWCAVLEACRSRTDRKHFRDSRTCVVRLGLTYLGVCDTSTDVERNLRAMSAFESGKSSNHYRVEILNAAMKVWMEAPRALGQLVDVVPTKHGNSVEKVWRAKTFISEAMDWYEQFYGKQKYKCRRVLAQQPDEIAVKT